MENNFKIGDRVKGYLVSDGEVWKVTDEAVHVKHLVKNYQTKEMEYSFIKFHFKPTHHMQTPIEKLRHFE